LIQRTFILGRRLLVALWALPQSIFRAKRNHRELHWNSDMTKLALGALLAAVLLFPFDADNIRFLRANSSGLFRLMDSITHIGQSYWYIVPAGLIVLSLGLMDWSTYSRKNKSRLTFLFGQAAFAFAAVALSGILVNILKFLIGRPRPRLLDTTDALQFQPFSIDSAFLSFPSGHATTLGAVAMILILWWPRLWAPLLLAGLVLASTRIVAQAHYPSDVVIGFALGSLYTLHLTRFLAVRGRVFRLVDGRLLPIMRHRGAWR
jgi:membrane-associated phospholipid phosphatase